MKAIQGCNSEVHYSVLKSEGVEYFTCPGRLRDPNWSNLMSMMEMYKNGVNPYGGPMIDMPNKFVEMYQAVYNLEIENQKGRTDGQRS